MNKTILFYFGYYTNSKIEGAMRLGEFATIVNACYFKGKELGYEDGNIYLQWPLIRYNYPHYTHISGIHYRRLYVCPKDGYLPIRFRAWHRYYNEFEFIIDKINFDEFNDIIDLDEPNSLYEGCLPYFSENSRDVYGCHNYLNKYYIDYGIRPELHMPKDKDEFNILIHYRHLHYSPERNTNFDSFKSMVLSIKKEFNDKINLHLTGDIYDIIKPSSQKEIFKSRHIPYIKNLNKMFKLINNSNIVIGQSSSVLDFARFIGIPFVNMNGIDLENGSEFGTKPYWNKRKIRYGEHLCSWNDENRYLHFVKDKQIDIDEIIKFIGKIYEESKV